MFWAILATSISSIWKVFFKKTTQYNISANLNDFLWHFLWLLCVIIIIIIWKFNFILTSYIDYVIIIVTFLLFLIQININQYVFQNEKISILIPFENLGKLITILLGVMFLWDNISMLSLVLFLSAIFVIFINSLNFKTFKFSKNVLLFCIAQWIVAIANFLTWYVLLNNSSLDYYNVYILISFLFITILCFSKWYFWDIKKLDKKYFIYRNIGSLVWVSWLINILLIWDLGLSVTTILWFFGIATGLITSYLVFRDIPSIRSVFVTIIVISLISIWYIYK